jgi:hypothetical protein
MVMDAISSVEACLNAQFVLRAARFLQGVELLKWLRFSFDF